MPSPTPDVTWFRLAVRAIGILVFALGLPAVFAHVASVATWLREGMPWGGEMLVWYVLPLLGPVAQLALGFYLIVGARPLIRYCTRGALGMCPACNYDVRQVPGPTCPECGVPLPGRAPPAVVSPDKPTPS